MATVTGIAKKADGTLLTGIVVKVRLITASSTEPGFLNGGSVLATEATTETHASTAAFSFSLEPNANITPANSYYRIEIPNGNRVKSFNISVPALGGTVEDLLHDPGTIEQSALTAHKLSVGDHGDVDLTGNATGKVLMWDGTNWVPADTVATDLEAAALVTAHDADTSVHGIADTSLLETTAGSAAKVATHEADTSVHGITDTTVLATDAEVAAGDAATLDTAKLRDGTSVGKATLVGGIVTLDIFTEWGIDGTPYWDAAGAQPGEEAALVLNPDGSWGVVPLTDSAPTTDWNTSPVDAVETHRADTTNVHGIADTSALETTTGSQAKVDAHTGDATAAHAATAISYAGSAGLSATEVEAALDELDTEKAPASASYVTMSAETGLSGETLLSALFSSGTNAARPAAGIAGRQYLTTDNPRGHWLDNGSDWLALGPITVVRTSDAGNITSSTTLQSDDTLILPVKANARYRVLGFILYQGANATMDIKFGWSVPAGTTMNWGALGGLASEVGGYGIRSTGQTPLVIRTASDDLQAGTAVGVTVGAAFACDVKTAGTAGNLTFRYAQATSDGGILKPAMEGSWLEMLRKL